MPDRSPDRRPRVRSLIGARLLALLLLLLGSAGCVDPFDDDTAVGLGTGPLNLAGSSYGAGAICASTGCSLGQVEQGMVGVLWVR